MGTFDPTPKVLALTEALARHSDENSQYWLDAVRGIRSAPQMPGGLRAWTAKNNHHLVSGMQVFFTSAHTVDRVVFVEPRIMTFTITHAVFHSAEHSTIEHRYTRVHVVASSEEGLIGYAPDRHRLLVYLKMI